MGVLTYFSFTTSEKTETLAAGESVAVQETRESSTSAFTQQSTPIPARDMQSEVPTTVELSTIATEVTTTEAGGRVQVAETQVKVRRFSLRAFGFVRKDSSASTSAKPMLSTTREHELREKAAASSKHAQNAKLSKSQKKAHQSALAVRDIIIGSPSNVAAPKVTPAFAKPQLNKIKSQLLEPKAANQVIAHLKQLPTNDSSGSHAGRHLHGPIHAVCLEHTDAEEHLLHFASLAPEDRTRSISVQEFSLSGVSAAPLDALSKMFKEMQIVDLIRSPDFGLGQPGDGDGILAGALPTAETVIDGIKQITPELMALGFATSKAVLPDHSGIYPPTDRISILTYWWGLEILLPPPTLGYLASAQSITGALMNFLSALSLVNNGVREILPFIRYIAQFIDFEFSSIQKQDEGNGVVCAATWIMPAALVPRPWDFPLPPAGAPASPESGVDKTSSQAGNVVPQPQAQPKQISSILDTVTTRVAVTA